MGGMFEGFMSPGVPPWAFWLFAGAAVLVQGISKSGFAGGAGILSLPLMMLVMPSPVVTGCLLPLLILCDLNAIYLHRRNKVWRHVLELYVPSILGTLIGTALWWWMKRQGLEHFDVPLKRFVGVIAIVFSAYIVGKSAALGWVERIRPGRRAAWGFGVAAGIFSSITHAAGPIVGLYLFAQSLGKSLFVGTTAWTFTLINLTKLPFFLGVGLINRRVLLFAACLAWLIPIGSYLGKWLHHRVSEQAFNRVILSLTLLAGVQLILNVNLVELGLRALWSGK